MTGRINTITNDELWLRCPYCGDSPHDPTKAHFSINLSKWLYHCYRCGEGGHLSTKEILHILADHELTGLSHDFEDYLEDEPVEQGLPPINPGAGSSRPSALTRGHVVDPSSTFVWDAFSMCDPHGEVIGVHLRTSQRKINFGERGFAWPGRTANLHSTYRQPMILVEGPYDVLDTNFFCCFGTISRSVLTQLIGQVIDLCPDGDIWTDPNKLANFTDLLYDLTFRPNQGPWPVVKGFYFLPDGLDPDEAWGKEGVQYFDRDHWTDILNLRTRRRRTNAYELKSRSHSGSGGTSGVGEVDTDPSDW